MPQLRSLCTLHAWHATVQRWNTQSIAVEPLLGQESSFLITPIFPRLPGEGCWILCHARLLVLPPPPSSFPPDLICQLLIPARVRALWASPDFNRRGSERCGPRRTSTARFGALWASPDFNRRDSARRGPRRTLTGPQRPETKPYRMPKRMCQIECQKICQIECQKICQISAR